MTDLIKRLRDTASKGVSVWGDLQMEAAKEIEILTAEREAYASAMDRMKTRLAEVENEKEGFIHAIMCRDDTIKQLVSDRDVLLDAAMEFRKVTHRGGGVALDAYIDAAIQKVQP